MRSRHLKAPLKRGQPEAQLISAVASCGCLVGNLKARNKEVTEAAPNAPYEEGVLPYFRAVGHGAAPARLHSG